MFNIRSFEKDDYNFIHVSWSYVMRGGFRKLKNPEYHDMINPIIKDKIDKGQIYVACSEDDHNFIYGFAAIKVIEGIPLVQMIYVKQPFRKFGILKSFIEKIKKDHGDALIGIYQRPFDKWIFEKFNIIYKPEFKDL